LGTRPETASGSRDVLSLYRDDITAGEIRSLLLAVSEHGDRSFAASADNWLINLYAYGTERATYYRLGCLALIDAPATAIDARF
jgi:hypothetical protein